LTFKRGSAKSNGLRPDVDPEGRLRLTADEFFSKITSDLPEQIKTIILTFGHRPDARDGFAQKQMQEQIEFLHRQGVKVLLEAYNLSIAQIGKQLGVD